MARERSGDLRASPCRPAQSRAEVRITAIRCHPGADQQRKADQWRLNSYLWRIKVYRMAPFFSRVLQEPQHPFLLSKKRHAFSLSRAAWLCYTGIGHKGRYVLTKEVCEGG